jgi:hypothetical protein
VVCDAPAMFPLPIGCLSIHEHPRTDRTAVRNTPARVARRNLDNTRCRLPSHPRPAELKRSLMLGQHRAAGSALTTRSDAWSSSTAAAISRAHHGPVNHEPHHAHRSNPEATTREQTAVEILRRWQDSGAVWRVLSWTSTHVAISLCTCVGAPRCAQRRPSSDRGRHPRFGHCDTLADDRQLARPIFTDLGTAHNSVRAAL